VGLRGQMSELRRQVAMLKGEAAAEKPQASESTSSTQASSKEQTS
jgi:hypothetical protein